MKHSRPLKILIINQSFWPDVVATSQQAHDLALYLARNGDSVSVVASRSLYGKPGANLPAKECLEGINIYRVSRNIFRKRGLFTRSIDYFRFSVACLLKCLFLPRQDIVICLTTPPFIALVGVILKWVMGMRFIFWEMDLYPDSTVQAGIIRRAGIVHRILNALDLMCLRRADNVVVLGSCMRRRILAKGIHDSKISTIHPWSDPLEINDITKPQPNQVLLRPNQFRAEWGIGDRFVIEYSGNYGIGHDVQTVTQAMLELKDDDSIRWVIVGDGIMKPNVVDFVNEHGLQNVVIQPYQPRSLLGPLLSLGDIHLVLMLPGYEGIILPSKFYGILAAARPAVFVGPAESEVAKVIREVHCGFIISNGDSKRLVQVIKQLQSNPQQIAEQGQLGRAALERHYSMQTACKTWRALLHDPVVSQHETVRQSSDYLQVARLHIDTIGHGFLSSLGEEFLSLVYRAIDDDKKNSFLILEWEGGKVIGFTSGTSNSKAMYSQLFRHLPSLIWSLRTSLISPSKIAGMFSTARYLRGGGPKPANIPSAELLSISVDTSHRGKGVADRLYHSLELEFAARGIQSFKIIVGQELLPAHKFYKRMGASEVGQFQLHRGASSLVFVGNITKSSVKKDVSS